MAIVIFTGHLIDHAQRSEERLPQRFVPNAQEVIQKHIRQVGNIDLAISSLATGGDMIFADYILQINAPLHIFLPFAEKDFIEQSVSYPQKTTDFSIDWLAHYHFIKKRATKVHFSTQECFKTNADFDKCNEDMLQFAFTQNKDFQTTIILLALLKPTQEQKKGGTVDFIIKAQSQGIQIDSFWLNPITLA